VCCGGCPRATRVKRKRSRGEGALIVVLRKTQRGLLDTCRPRGLDNQITIIVVPTLLLHVRVHVLVLNQFHVPSTENHVSEYLHYLHFLRASKAVLRVCWTWSKTIVGYPHWWRRDSLLGLTIFKCTYCFNIYRRKIREKWLAVLFNNKKHFILLTSLALLYYNIVVIRYGFLTIK